MDYLKSIEGLDGVWRRGNAPLRVKHGDCCCSGGGRVGGRRLHVPAALPRLLVVVERAVRMVVQDVPLSGGGSVGGGGGGVHAVHVIHRHRRRRRGSGLDQFKSLHLKKSRFLN